MRRALRTMILLATALAFALHLPMPLNAEEIPQERLLLLAGQTRLEVTRGEVFSINLFLDRTDPEDVVMELPDLPAGIEIDSVPVLISRADGVVEARIEGIARQAGRFVINPILIETATGPWFVPRILVEAAPARGERVPFGARWRPLQDPVYQGQSVPVVLEITGIDTFTYPEGISVRSPQSGLFEETSGIGSVISDTVAGIELFQIPVAVFLFTPTSSGEVVLPSAEVTALGITATAPALNLEVGRLPSMVEPSGAVGRFSLEVGLDRRALAPGETAQLEIVLEGAGNLPVLDMPEVTLVGLRVLEQIEGGEFVADTTSLLGYRGERTRTIRLEPEEGAGRGTIRVEAFSYYDPAVLRVVTTAPRLFELELPTVAGAVETGREPPRPSLLSSGELKQLRWYRILDMQWPLLFFLIGPALFAVVRLLAVRRKTGGATAAVIAGMVLFTSAAIIPYLNMQRLERAEELIRAGEYAVAGVLYELELQDHPGHAGLHYNRGVLALRSENALASVYHLRRAVRLAPERGDFRGVLNEAIAYFDLTDQIGVPGSVRPDILILLLIAVWSAFWMVLLAPPTLPRSIGLVSLLMVGVIVLAGVLWSVQVASRPEGIVRRELTVRRIPDESAEPWVHLHPVTTVQIELSYNDFYLVRTSSGVTGWVPRRDIRRFGVYR
ncbi:MAG: hypothetical protein EA427_16460 [Spirochaetaceae bacterium]|nr:MAG: hypothetical protein EA427_16460 [Spirochaetaceae bacterium]